MKATILSNREIGPGYFRLTISDDENLLKSGIPGQFIMVRGNWESDPLLGRPFSIYLFDADNRGVDIIFRVVGRGTYLLSQLKTGDSLDILGPLGNGFIPPPTGKRVILVAGGVGVSPLMALSESMSGSATLIMAGRTRDDVLYVKEDADELGINIKYVTEDGGTGIQGTAISAMKEIVSSEDIIFASGPKGMLEEISRLSNEIGFDAYVSWEERMACGMGLCLGCAARGSNGEYLLTCKDGPVFDVRELSWDDDDEND